jgi:UDP-N-acetylglucosamine:LPS N-acetylglucosamine transferase
MRLKGWWSEHPRRWVSFDKPDVRSSLDGEELDFGHHPTTRNVGNLIRNLLLAVRLLRRHRPDLVVSNGAGLAVAFFWIGWLMRIPSVWIEVYDRIDSATMTGRLVAPVSSAICVQWPEQLDLYPNATLVGPVW